MASFSTIPHEVLELIALFAATDDVLGPPAGIVPLLTLDRRTHAALSSASNPLLWSRIFAAKFDVSSAARRLGPARLTPRAICDELAQRCYVLKRIRSRSDCLATSFSISPTHREGLKRVLWKAYLMMLENEGRNERQLREYARFDVWLKDFLFHPSGASLAASSIKADLWPPQTDTMSLGLWLFWYLLRPEEYMGDESTFENVSHILKLYALGAHQYDLSSPTWHEFLPIPPLDTYTVNHYAAPLTLHAPPPAAPSILSYLTLANKPSVAWDTIHYMKPVSATTPSSIQRKRDSERDAEWNRATHLGKHSGSECSTFSSAFIPGSLEGVWEGMFTYTEFTSYAALLAGAPPTVLQRSLIAHHPHLWKLREHHLYEADGAEPVEAGNPLRAFIPDGATLCETERGLEVREERRASSTVYRPWARVKADGPEERTARGRLLDIFVMGEGHSAWGEFNLVGRIRPSDGFISLSKEYVDGDRGNWLYRGYLVGNADGNLAGRWRDTLSDADMQGYEGCFVMSRRK